MKLFPFILTALTAVSVESSTLLAQDTTCHSLVVRIEPLYNPGNVDTDLVRAQIFARPSGANDRVFMVFGQADLPLSISSDNLAYNHTPAGFTNEFNGSSTQSLEGPEYVNDSYVTLGQFGPTPTDGSGTSAIVETDFFPIGSEGTQTASDFLRSVFHTGSSSSTSSFYYDGAVEFGWGIASSSEPSLGANSMPDTEGLVALAQITLPENSSLSGTLNFKVQPNGNSNLPAEVATISFDIPAITENQVFQFENAGGGIAGCTDESACNFNELACLDDESCEYVSCIGCTDESACNFNPDATVDDTCEYNSCAGCTDEDACNYDSTALIDDASCVFPGCTNGCACNYNPNACIDDGSCEYADALGNCGGDCSSDMDGDDICDDEDDCVGMLDSCGICNGPGAIYDCGCSDIPEGDCDCDGNQPDAIGACGGDCLADADGNGICDADEVLGCTVEEACNYDENATLNDGSCDFLACLVFGCTNNSACNYDVEATVDDGSCKELDNCGVCGGLGEAFQCGCANIPVGDCDCDGNQLDALGVCGGVCLADNDGDGLCDADQGCTYSDAANYNDQATVDDGSCEWNNTCPADLNGDGFIQLNDLLDLLGDYNSACP